MKKQTHRILTARLRKMSLLALTCSIGLGACGGENEKANEFDKELAISELKAKESTVERDVVLAYNSKTKENEYFDTATLPSDVVSECYSWQEEFAVDEFADLVVGEEGDYPGTVPANVAMVDGYAIDFEDFHIDAETHEKKLAKKNGKNSPLVAFDNLVEGTKPVKDDFLPGWDDDHGDHWDCLPEQDIFEDYLYKDDVYRIIGFIIFHLADAVLNGDIGNNHPSYPIDWDLPYPDETYPGDWDMPSPTPFPYDDLYPAEEFLGKSCEGIDIAITNEGTLCEKEGLFVYVECFHMSENDYGFEKIPCVTLRYNALQAFFRCIGRIMVSLLAFSQSGLLQRTSLTQQCDIYVTR